MRKTVSFADALSALGRYCAYQDRSHRQAEEKMRDFDLTRDEKDEILCRLIGEKFLDEERFTRSFVRGKYSIKYWGRLRIGQALRIENIPERLIDTAMDEIDENIYSANLKKLALSKVVSGEMLDDFSAKAKIVRFLQGKGYEYDLIEAMLSEIREGLV